MSDYGERTAPGTVRLTRVLPGPIERVWAHLTESDKRARWFAAGEAELRVGGKVTLHFDHASLSTPMGTMVRAEVEARVGGRFVFTDRRDGTDVEHRGEWLELDRPRRLVFAFSVPGAPDPTQVAIDVEPAEGGSELVLTHEMPRAADFRERTLAGWTAILAALARTLGV